MDLDDEVSSPIYLPGLSNPMTTTIAPNHFLLSTYDKNLRSYHSSQLHLNQSGHQKSNTSSYKCCLCRKIVDDATLTCAKCVNTGQFCPPKHDTCSNKRRQLLASLLNSIDYEEFQQFSAKNSLNNPPHLQCSDRMFLLKKFQNEKTRLQNEYQSKIESVLGSYKMSEEIAIRKNRLVLAQQHIEKLREQIERKKQMNILIEQRKTVKESHMKLLERKIDDIKTVIHLSNEKTREKNEIRIDCENKLHYIRRQRINETYKYVFPIEYAASVEDNLALTMRALSSAQQSIAEETNSDCSENEETVNMTADRYQIVNSCLPINGDYQIPKLLLTVEVDKQNTDSDSFQSTLSHELYEVLSALSHACQLINVIAFYLHIALPFRLHQLEFNTDTLTGDRLRADIAKLNANIVTSCMSQGIPMENTQVTHTLENLWKLLTYKQYRSRPKPVIYSQQYIDAMEEEVNEISRAYVTEYWFDDVEKDVNDLLNSDEWETVPQDYNIPDDPSIHERLGSLPSFANQQQQQQHQQNLSVMSGSIGFLRNRGSNLINSVFSSFRRT